MAMLTWDGFMRPVLEVLAERGELSRQDLMEAVADHVKLTGDERREVLPSGQPRYKNRIGWAQTDLYKAGALARPSRAHYAITERGRELLRREGAVTRDWLLEFAEYRAYTEISRSKEAKASEDGQSDAASSAALDEAPMDLIARASGELRAALEAELLDRLREIDPYAFERLVLKVLGAMGYGKDGSLAHTAKSGDGGIDGIISQDPLGLDRIYLQAKRYSGANVQSPLIDAFMGAMSANHGDRGVFITTAQFSSGAKERAGKFNARIELIDGPRLARLMIDAGVGVQTQFTAIIHKIDEDFFDEL